MAFITRSAKVVESKVETKTPLFRGRKEFQRENVAIMNEENTFLGNPEGECSDKDRGKQKRLKDNLLKRKLLFKNLLQESFLSLKGWRRGMMKQNSRNLFPSSTS